MLERIVVLMDREGTGVVFGDDHRCLAVVLLANGFHLVDPQHLVV